MDPPRGVGPSDPTGGYRCGGGDDVVAEDLGGLDVSAVCVSPVEVGVSHPHAPVEFNGQNEAGIGRGR